MSAWYPHTQAWRKSSFSGQNGSSECCLVAFAAEEVLVRDSKVAQGPVLRLPRAAWRDALATLVRPPEPAGG
ncbi:DUF397 domain-containing protein [Streptomyces sp. DSM 44915]|uniref:DUF397 domain-containing protein n=1 Tax=Streptomyces chisholmiae TaxID=3075540 RepID=A0ABU2JT60_9ACTN|nr:DUF397 domain-containing protein [Streptomyces sp. DSM 44915]MDT0268160.1 DUF397 domain-containing protein [Streptomyces sp. DSM 44915]